MISCPGYAGGGIAAGRFEQDAVRRNVGKLLAHLVGVAGVGHDQDILFRHYRQEALVAHLQQRAACAEKVNELFRLVRTAVGPEAAAYATAHYHAISMFVVVHRVGLFSVVGAKIRKNSELRI